MHLHWVSVGNNVINVGVIVWVIHELMIFVCILALEVCNISESTIQLLSDSERIQWSYDY